MDRLDAASGDAMAGRVDRAGPAGAVLRRRAAGLLRPAAAEGGRPRPTGGAGGAVDACAAGATRAGAALARRQRRAGRRRAGRRGPSGLPVRSVVRRRAADGPGGAGRPGGGPVGAGAQGPADAFRDPRAGVSRGVPCVARGGAGRDGGPQADAGGSADGERPRRGGRRAFVRRVADDRGQLPGGLRGRGDRDAALPRRRPAGRAARRRPTCRSASGGGAGR